MPCKIISPICFVTLQALSETIPSIWLNVNIDYLPACQILFSLIVGESNKIHKGGNYQDFVKWGEGGGLLLGNSFIIIKLI